MFAAEEKDSPTASSSPVPSIYALPVNDAVADGSADWCPMPWLMRGNEQRQTIGNGCESYHQEVVARWQSLLGSSRPQVVFGSGMQSRGRPAQRRMPLDLASSQKTVSVRGDESNAGESVLEGVSDGWC